MTADFRAIRDAFFDRWRERHPEEASTLGIDDPIGRLSDPSWEAIEGEARDLQATLDALAALPALDPEDALDRFAIESLARHEVARVAQGAHLANVELGLLPYHLARHFLVHARDARAIGVARARVAAIPAFLDAHARTLERGVREDARAHAGIVSWIADRTIPSIAGALRALDATLGAGPCEDAARAYERHADFLRARVLPRATATSALGAEITRARLEHGMGITRPAEALLDEARSALAHAHEGLLEAAAATPRFAAAARSVPALREEIDRAYAIPLAARDEDVLPAIREVLTRATAFARAHGLVPASLPDPLAVRVLPMPPAISEAGHAQNWAAPLCALEPHADYLATVDHTVHPEMAAPLLAVHEGVPGHSMQSLAFAGAHGRDPRPVRFLVVADDVAMARSFFGSMLSIEGWATWVEHRMLELGFYEGDALVFAWNVRAIRAARVIADLEIHLGARTPEEACALLVRDAFVPQRLAEREVLRYQRIPLQALTYLTGALAIERLLASRAITIDDLLERGPIPPEVLAATSPRSPRPT